MPDEEDLLSEPPPDSMQETVSVRLRVPPEYAGYRLDQFLQRRLVRLSRSRIQSILRNHADQAPSEDARRWRASRLVSAGEEIVLCRKLPREPEVPRHFGVIHEDDAVLAIDKPAGLPVHPTARYFHNTLTSLLHLRYGKGAYHAMAHRLDRETSGVVLVAKQRAAGIALKLAFAQRRVHKHYLAVVEGQPADEEGVVELAVRPAQQSRVRVRMETCKADADGAQAAVSRWRVLERLGRYALLEVSPQTGRQHQIRVHLAAIGHPVAADKIYGPDELLFLDYCDNGWSPRLAAALPMERHALHAHRIEFQHPVSREWLMLTAPVPADMALLMRRPVGVAA